jgi:hypothetical protein
MATANNEIIQPVLREPDALVENIYPLPGTEALADLESQTTMGEYLIDRFTPDEGPQTRWGLTPIGHTLPGIIRVPAGTKEVSRSRKVGPVEWLVTPRQAAAVVLGSMALFNFVGNHGTIESGTHYVAHKVYRVFDAVGTHPVIKHKRVVTEGKVSKINVTAASPNEVGSTSVSPNSVKLFATDLKEATHKGAKILSVKIEGNASDEWRTEHSIGTKNADNVKLGEARARAAKEALLADDTHIPHSKVNVTSAEHILSPVEKQTVLREGKADGYPTIEAAVTAVDEGQRVPKTLGQTIKHLFTSKKDRGVELSARVAYPGVQTVSMKPVTTHVANIDHDPNVPKPSWYWFLPMIPLGARRRERYNVTKQLKRWEMTPSAPILRPTLIREQQDQAWLRLRPEAVKEDKTLDDHAWAFTRKYEYLLRENRIADVLSAEYDGADGEKKSIRIMFVDKSPAEADLLGQDGATIKAFSALLKQLAAMEDGKLGGRIRGIFVYPSENAGTGHGDPKRVGMGIDKQSSENILGTYTYPLNLVELHMPSTWDESELLGLFESHNGPMWVAAHEAAGHGTDISNQTLRLKEVRARGIPQAHVIKGDARARKMRPLEKVLQSLDSIRRVTNPVEFDINYIARDLEGEDVTLQARVREGDPRLEHALQSTIVGYNPTVYAGTNVGEQYAEHAASVTTGITIPYDEASIAVRGLQADNGERASFAEGYRPDARGQRQFTDSVGAELGSFPATFAEPPVVRISHINPANDPLIQQHLARTHRLRILQPEQMVAILARVTQQARRGRDGLV